MLKTISSQNKKLSKRRITNIRKNDNSFIAKIDILRFALIAKCDISTVLKCCRKYSFSILNMFLLEYWKKMQMWWSQDWYKESSFYYQTKGITKLFWKCRIEQAVTTLYCYYMRENKTNGCGKLYIFGILP